MMLAHVLLLSCALVVITVTIHFLGITAILSTMRARLERAGPATALWRQGALVLVSVLGLIGLHAVEIWVYALAYLALGEFHDLESALYFATATFSTVGYGDVVLDSQWRILSAVEGVNGFVLIGWSTAVLVGVNARMRAAEDRFLSEADQT